MTYYDEFILEDGQWKQTARTFLTWEEARENVDQRFQMDDNAVSFEEIHLKNGNRHLQIKDKRHIIYKLQEIWE